MPWCWSAQVEPVRWPHTIARKVINSAVEEAVSEALLQDAQRAIDRGFQGSISRSVCRYYSRCCCGLQALALDAPIYMDIYSLGVMIISLSEVF